MENNMKNNKRKIIIISVIMFILISSAISLVIVYNFPSNDKERTNQVSDILISKDKKMVNQVSDIINQVKGNEKVELNSVYELKNIKDLGIDIPLSPYGTEYTEGSYVKNFNGIYYASFDNGKQKVSGNENELEFSEKGSFDFFWESKYNATEEEKKIVVKDKLKKKYGEEFEIDYIQSSVNYLAQYDGDDGKAYPVKDGKEKSFDFHIYKFEQMTDSYYDILIENEYKKLIMKGINKIDSKAKLIYFPNDTYGDEVSNNLSLKEALKKQIINKTIYISTYSDLKEKDINKIKNYLLEVNYSGLFNIYKTKKDKYSKINDFEKDSKLLQYATLYSFNIYDGKIENEETKVLDKNGL